MNMMQFKQMEGEGEGEGKENSSVQWKSESKFPTNPLVYFQYQ